MEKYSRHKIVNKNISETFTNLIKRIKLIEIDWNQVTVIV
jgi:hypothetical protein